MREKRKKITPLKTGPTNRKSRRRKPLREDNGFYLGRVELGGTGGHPGDMSPESLNWSLRFGMTFKSFSL